MTTYTGTPRTWAAAEKVTAALLNAELRDPLLALSGAWTSYTPTLAGFTPGNGTGAGAYVRVNKLIIFRASFTFGSTSAAASATPTLTLPVTAALAPFLSGWGELFLGSTAYFADARLTSTSVVALYPLSTSGNFASAAECSTTTPATWATGDVLRAAGVYEAA